MEQPRETTTSNVHKATLKPLNDPSKQIRLLKLDAAEFDDEVQCSVLTCDLSSAPDFNAISYTWGPEQPQRDIRIDGARFTVRENCHYAIRQARLHDSSQPVWVDSICINQDDLQEKSAQVGFMGDIYARADTVLACIGPSDEASDAIEARLGKPFKTAGPGQPQATRYPVPGNLAERRDLYRIWAEFCARPYFHRVWIAQELYEGRGRTVVLCGRSALPWVMVVTFGFQLELSKGRQPTSSIANMAKLAAYGSMLLSHALARSANLLCADARDRIYAMVRLVDWHASDVPRPAPDYTLSVIDVLTKLSRRGEAIDIATFQSLANAMRLSDSDFAGPDDEVADWIGHIHDAQVIQLRDDGRLCIDRKATADGQEDDVADPRTRFLFGGHEPVQILGFGGVIAVACPETKAGDIILETSSFHIVVRPTAQPHWYRLVGRAKISEANCYPLGLDRDAPKCCCSSPGAQGKRNIAVPATIRFRAQVQDVLYQIAKSATDPYRLSPPGWRTAETYEGELSQHKLVDIPLAGFMLRDVTFQEHQRWYAKPCRIRLPLPTCPRHTQDTATYHEAAERGPLWYLATTGGGYEVDAEEADA
ncbi:HET domain-containing protein [Microdochium nivale]|nr:HET domain-containing protein [Microdochium nivale]